LIARETLFPFFIGSRPHTFLVIVVLLGACGIGSVGLGRRWGLWATVLAVGPVVAALVASTVGGYPIAARLMIYAAPLLMLTTAEAVVTGIAWVRRPATPRAARVLVVGSLALLGDAAAPDRRPALDLPSAIKRLRGPN